MRSAPYMIIFLTMLLWTFPGMAWSEEAGQTGSNQRFDEAVWQQKVSKARYFEEKEMVKEIEGDPAAIRGLQELPVGPVKYLMLGLVIVAAAFLLLKVLAPELFSNRGKPARPSDVFLNDAESRLREAPLDSLLQSSLESRDYAQAVRIYYLMVLRQLDRGGLIRWQKGKTNAHYMAEMRQHSRYHHFAALTRIFERIWYSGYRGVSPADFRMIEPSFKEMLESLAVKAEN